MTSQKLNEEHEILRRFMAVVVSSAFWAKSQKGTSRKPPRSTLVVKKISHTTGLLGGRRFSEVLSETLSEEDFPLGTLGPIAPHRLEP